jgi:hypothetical protein
VRRLLLSLAVLLAAGLAAPPSAGAAAGAAAEGDRPIRPGVQMITEGAQCTANFVFERTTRKRVRVKRHHQRAHQHRAHHQRKHHRRFKVVKHRHLYVGMAAHCAGKGSSDDTDGCTTPTHPLGTPVQFVTGANLLTGGAQVGSGRLRYSSWQAMQAAGTSDPDACAYNDFALVEVPRSQRDLVDPTVPQLGGPTGLAELPAAGSRIFTLGSSSLRGTTQAKSGSVTSSSAWTMTVRTGSPGVPGDSGSGYLDDQGRAVGVLSTLNILPDIGANGVGSLAREVAFARDHDMRRLRLVTGGPFTAGSSTTTARGGLLGLGLGLL